MPEHVAWRDGRFGLVGTTLERRFRIDAIIAEGGFGVVYRSYQIALDRPVALKVLKVPADLTPSERAQFQRGFADEARTIGRLRHPHIVEVHDFGISDRADGAPLVWMALEWLDGDTLETLLDRRRGKPGVTPVQALRFMRPVIEAVAYAHASRVAHRDLKPANIMLVPLGPQSYAKVLDFGVAKMMSPDELAGRGNRRSGGLPGFSPAYAAPEQVTGGRTGPWTDVHALALVMSELLTNRPPYGPETPDWLDKVLEPRRPTPAAHGVDAGSWEAVLERALAHRPTDRYPDAAALMDALDRAAPPVDFVCRPSAKEPPASVPPRAHNANPVAPAAAREFEGSLDDATIIDHELPKSINESARAAAVRLESEPPPVAPAPKVRTTIEINGSDVLEAASARAAARAAETTHTQLVPGRRRDLLLARSAEAMRAGAQRLRGAPTPVLMALAGIAAIGVGTLLAHLLGR